MSQTSALGKPTRTRPLVRWDPFREIEDAYYRMGQIIQGFFGDGGWQPFGTLADIEETDDAFMVDIDLPGVSPQNMNLEVRDSELRVTGEYKDRERTGVLRRRARRIGEFEHTVTLPGEIDPDRVDAELRNGVLTVKIAKSGASRARRIEIKGG